MLQRLFTAHPASVGETYGEHFAVAAYFARQLFVAALACFLHALLPFLFEKTASGIVRGLYGRMVAHRARAAEAPRAVPEQASAASERVSAALEQVA